MYFFKTSLGYTCHLYINSHCNDKKFQPLKTDTSIIRTLEVGPDGVHIRGAPLYSITRFFGCSNPVYKKVHSNVKVIIYDQLARYALHFDELWLTDEKLRVVAKFQMITHVRFRCVGYEYGSLPAG